MLFMALILIKNKKPIPRRNFMLELSNALITPWLELRKNCKRDDRYMIFIIF